MKIAVTIAGSEAKASAFVVWRGFEESIRKAAEYGYEGVELAMKQADELDWGKLNRWLKEYHMEVSCITTGQVFADLGLYFTHPDKEMRQRTIAVFSGLVDMASEYGGIVNAGRTRGFVGPGQSRKEAENLFIDTMGNICDIADKKGVSIIIEPVNRYEINFINNLDEGSALLKQMGKANCGLHADVFHMNIEDDSIGGSLIRNGDMVRYVHLADSNRFAPGMGHLNFDEVFAALGTIGYDGWVSIEILPGSDPDKMARASIDYLRPRVLEYNRRF